MPFREILSFVNQPVCTGFGKPFEFTDFFSVEFYAFRLLFKAVLVILAATGFAIKQVTGNTGVKNSLPPKPSVNDFSEAASTATVAEKFPFVICKVF